MLPMLLYDAKYVTNRSAGGNMKWDTTQSFHTPTLSLFEKENTLR